ncbi:hypothetical protein ACA910_017617 [Epithemia clementina (nom. ined.)]
MGSLLVAAAETSITPNNKISTGKHTTQEQGGKTARGRRRELTSSEGKGGGGMLGSDNAGGKAGMMKGSDDAGGKGAGGMMMESDNAGKAAGMMMASNDAGKRE